MIDDERRAEDIDPFGVIAQAQAHPAEHLGSVAPVVRPDQTLRSKCHLLPAGAQAYPASLTVTELENCRAACPRVPGQFPPCTQVIGTEAGNLTGGILSHAAGGVLWSLSSRALGPRKFMKNGHNDVPEQIRAIPFVFSTRSILPTGFSTLRFPDGTREVAGDLPTTLGETCLRQIADVPFFVMSASLAVDFPAC